MNMIIELSVALVAIAFAILVFFLIKTLQSAKGISQQSKPDLGGSAEDDG